MNFYSHPNILLKDHLKNVGLLSRRYVEATGLSDDKIIIVAELIGKTHDFAKYTTFFQNHLAGKKVKKDLSKHSELSAALASWIVYKRLNDPILARIAFLCVYSHHGSLVDFTEDESLVGFIEDERENELSLLDSKSKLATRFSRQIKSIEDHLSEISVELREIGIPEAVDFITELTKNPSEVSRVIKEIVEESRRRLYYKLRDDERWKLYFTILLLYSSLIDADKKDAAKVAELITSRQLAISAEAIEVYKRYKFADQKASVINILRNELFEDVKKSLHDILNNTHVPRILTITAPTGIGKTILGLYVALKLRENSPLNPRIIYCLPYISIIEQTHSVFKDILCYCLDKEHEEELPISLLLKYHHLSFPSEKSEEMDLDKLLLFIDSWESEIIVTTFEQLFRSLINCDNRPLKKFHNIANSIIILDEVQSLPDKYWSLVRNLMEHVCKELNVTVVLMTATMPMIFKDYTELVSKKEYFFKKLNRVTLIPYLKEDMDFDKLVEFFFSKWTGGKSAVIVLNTIKASKEVYKRLAMRLQGRAIELTSKAEGDLNDSSIILAYLSSYVIPKGRKARIDAIKKLLKEGRKVILVSTQVIEAGVDLDFDMAIRDIGPIDSIVQVSGRCNRSWEREHGEVYIVRLKDEESGTRRIYGSILPDLSFSLLKDKGEVHEPDLLDLVNSYYRELSEKMMPEESEESKEVMKSITNLAFNKLSGFSLIEEEPKIPIFIEFDDEATELLNIFNKLVYEFDKCKENLDEIFKLKADMRKLLVEMENYIVEVWVSEEVVHRLPFIREGVNVRLVRREFLDSYYDTVTGFKTSEEQANQPVIL